MAGRKRHGRRSATAEALAGLLIVAAAFASIAALVIHSSHQFSTTHDSVKDYLPTFVGSSAQRFDEPKWVLFTELKVVVRRPTHRELAVGINRGYHGLDFQQ